MANPKVSILVIFYNQEKLVDRALSSVMNQKTDFDFEVLVGDDGSSDNTCIQIRKWVEKYPDVIKLHVMDRKPGKQVSGFRASRIRLNLLQYVNGQYFTVLDGDDFYDYNLKLQTQVDILEDSRNRDCITCAHNIDRLFPDGKRIPMASPEIKEGKYQPLEYWKKNIYFSAETMLTRSSVISSIPINLVENNFNDNIMAFIYLQKGKIYYIPKSWCVYVQTGDGVWTSNNQVVNSIRNMFIYDICNQINPEMRKETTRRFRYTWLETFSLRKQISPEHLKPYVEEAENKKMEASCMWLHYNSLDIKDKMMLCLRTFNICKGIIPLRILSLVYHFIIDSCNIG